MTVLIKTGLLIFLAFHRYGLSSKYKIISPVNVEQFSKNQYIIVCRIALSDISGIAFSYF